MAEVAAVVHMYYKVLVKKTPLRTFSGPPDSEQIQENEKKLTPCTFFYPLYVFPNRRS